MTEEKIINALKLHASEKSKCLDCPYYHEQACSYDMAIDALDLINRQKAENEKLQSDNSSMQSTLAKMSMGVEEAKAEAIKEFAERLKAECRQDRYAIQTSTKFGVVDKKYLRVVDESDIDNLVKEMVGADNG